MDQMKIVNYQNLPYTVTKTVDTGKTIFDENGGYALKILGKDDTGKVIAQRYKLVNLDKVEALSVPTIQKLSGLDGQEIHLDKLTQESIGSSMFHAQNFNLDTIEKVINLLLQNQAISNDNMNKIVEFFNGLSDSELSQITQNIADTIGQDFYDKEQVDSIIKKLEMELKNIQDRFPDSPNPNGYFPPNYTGNTNVNEDPKLSARLQKMKNELEASK